MLKREVTYEDYDGETQTETFFFNLTKTECLELEVEYKGGLAETINKIIKTENHKELVAHFKRLVLMSYGEKSDDGKKFIKSDAMRKEFEQHAAYSVLFMELATDSKKGAEFVNGILPRGMVEEAEAEALKQKMAESLATKPQTDQVPTTAELSAQKIPPSAGV